jgi:hypothetical protein
MGEPMCPQCRTAMVEGFMTDRGHHNGITVAEWIEGAPEKRWWGFSLKGKTRLKAKTYRCARCGLLQSYAPAP